MMAVPYEMLLYPELLGNEQLMRIIQERHLRVDNMELMSREDLIDLFRHYCVPYGQRKYRDTGRGKVLNKIRNFNPEPAPPQLSEMNLNHCSQESHLKRERLKPPPVTLGGQIKRIKVDNIVKIDPLDNIKRKMTIDSLTAAMGVPPPKKERKSITWP